jgi:hypothetical protein
VFLLRNVTLLEATPHTSELNASTRMYVCLYSLFMSSNYAKFTQSMNNQLDGNFRQKHPLPPSSAREEGGRGCFCRKFPSAPTNLVLPPCPFPPWPRWLIMKLYKPLNSINGCGHESPDKHAGKWKTRKMN